MRYKLINTSISAEAVVYDVVNKEAETDKDGNITKEAETVTTETDKYSCSITMTLVDTESENDGTFTRSITSTSDNKQTGFEVDEQRTKEITEYLLSLEQK